ncbi:RidA family protein [Mucilaginibacter sp. L3T2-6]|uniref:RidA family protein n=1 Tax=Mucilaginibacter sp. L3T2-6 TaxID=3062491 RepID=UPI00267659E2|nr:RidA family protein [Mucilaginibacter sp. L3T2-6]MDO3641308.1 RidA family protein [Mucilaginibacter sp. L3T2-6]MDV6213932.1 RidA family protein [Mucilaginibacter sp. L3T2-6]
MKQIILSNNAPEPYGPYSQAVASGNLVFVAGQIPIDAADGQLVPGGIRAQTRQVMEYIRAILTEAGLDFSHVVKVSLFLTDLQVFAEVNEVYSNYFTGKFPARETVQVAALPRNAAIEISVIAVKP